MLNIYQNNEGTNKNLWGKVTLTLSQELIQLFKAFIYFLYFLLKYENYNFFCNFQDFDKVYFKKKIILYLSYYARPFCLRLYFYHCYHYCHYFNKWPYTCFVLFYLCWFFFIFDIFNTHYHYTFIICLFISL